jgi:hypothetical protein
VRIAGSDIRPQDTLNIKLTPARHRPMTASTPTQVAFSGEVVPRIQEMGRYFHEIAPREEESIHGYVIKLETKETGGTPHGPVVVSALIDGKQKKVTISLSEDEHQKAIRAYKEGLEVSCRGTLKKVGQNWQLQDPGRLSIRSES